jgi:DNA-directed RNA polymerase subunit alpha
MRVRWKGFELPTHVVKEEESADGRYARFVAEPFMRGYGETIGISLRRVLLSSLEGTAVTSMRLRGADHEFTALPGVYEDVTDIVLNSKEILMQFEGDGPIVLRLEKSGKGPVTAGDIQVGAGMRVVNPDLVLCSLVEEKASFEAEFTVAKGRGYQNAEDRFEAEKPDVGVIPMDSIFSPVRRVKHTVENTRVGQLTNFDKLVLEIWTNGVISPEDALVEASAILRKHYNPFVKYHELGRELEREHKGQALTEGAQSDEDRLRELREKLALPIPVLDPSVRAENCLEAADIQTIGDLVTKAEEDMLKIKNFGKTSLNEIKRKLADMGLSFNMKLPEGVLPPKRKELVGDASAASGGEGAP